MKPVCRFAVVYRWRLHPGAEPAFRQAWETMTRAIVDERGDSVRDCTVTTRAGRSTWGIDELP